nr:MAG TPA: DNA polymerase II small subunit [Caudoviricetes sp.]
MTPLDEAIIENDLLPEDQRASNVELAARFNTSESSVRRHRAKLKRRGAPDMGHDAFFNDVPVDAILQRGKTIRLPDGSYEKITWKPGAVEMAEAKRVSYEDLNPVFQEPILPKPTKVSDASTKVVCLADFQVGKALEDSTPVLTTDGWKCHGDLRPGMFVYGRDGKPKRILAVTGSTEQDLFDVTFPEGRVLRATSGHLWSGRRRMHPKGDTSRREDRKMTLTTAELAKIAKTKANVTRPFKVWAHRPIELPETTLPIDPYILGFWLGDGRATGGCIAKGAIDRDHLLTLGHEIKSREGMCTIVVDGLTTALRLAGLKGNKHIPETYLRASSGQRLALLQGLMDSDGYCNPKSGYIEFSNTNKGIVEGVLALLHLEGVAPKVTTAIGHYGDVQCKQYWRIQFRAERPMFRLQRKAAHQRLSTERRDHRLSVIAVVPAGRGMAQCITVEGGEYLAGKELTLTHNCGSGGGTEDTVRLVRRAIKDIADDIRFRGPYRRIILADVGDSTEGFWNVASQAQTNDLSLTDQIRAVQRLYAEALHTLAPLCSSLYYVAVPSNHCAVRTGPGKNSRANAPDDDFGIMISKNIEDIIAGRPGYEHVTFHRPEKWEEAVTVDAADGTRIGFTHGHLAGSQSKVPGWFRDLAFGRRSGLYDARILVHGHWHNFAVSQAGDARWIISCPSADRGSDWWTNISGDSTKPAILTFEAQGGNASSWELYS